MDLLKRDPHYFLAFICCVFMLSITIFSQKYLPGIDLPQHAHMLRMFTDYVLGREPLYRQYYELQLFTPYILSYLVALPISAVFGAVIAIKMLVFLSVLLLVLGIRRWLLTVGADHWMSLTGFVTGLGYCYLWGFLPLCVSLGFGFFLLASVNAYLKAEDGTTVNAAPITTFSVLLALCHGMSFVFFSIATLLRARSKKTVLCILTCLAPGIFFVSQWVVFRYSHKTNFSPDLKALHPPKLEALGGGLFSAYPSQLQMLAGVLLLLVLFLALRIRIPKNRGVTTPILLSASLFLLAPTSTFSTWLVAQRFAGILHIFLPLCFYLPRFGDKAKYSKPIFTALVLSFQLLFAAKVAGFNSELLGLRLVSKYIGPNSNLRSSVMRGDDASIAFGKDALSQSVAWVSAETGRFLENDSSFYIQMPLQKRPIASREIRYRYIITSGENYSEKRRVELQVTQGKAKLLAKSLPWAVYEILE